MLLVDTANLKSFLGRHETDTRERFDERLNAKLRARKHPGSTSCLGPLSADHMAVDALWEAWCFVCEKCLAIGSYDDVRNIYFTHEHDKVEHVWWAIDNGRIPPDVASEVAWVLRFLEDSGAYHAYKTQQIAEDLECNHPDPSPSVVTNLPA